MNLYKWSTTAGSNSSAVPDGAPDGWLGQNVNEWARETMARVREQASDAAYIDETYQLSAVGTKSLTRASSTQLTIQSCDATAHFTTGRRIRIVGATTDHGFVTSSSYSAPNTSVNVTMDSGDVPTSPTQVLVHVDSKIRSGAYATTGSGNGLDADKVDGYHAADIFGPAIFAEALVNGGMSISQRGSAVSCPVSTVTYTADRWFVNPSGAGVTYFQVTTPPTGAISKYASKIVGANSVTTVDFGQRIESHLIPYIKTTITISALVKNDTGASLSLSLRLGTPSAADNFTTVTNRLSTTLTSVSAGASARLTHTVDISGYTNIDNGLELVFRVPSGSIDAIGRSVTITEVQIDRASTFSYFRLRQIPDDLVRCLRYYQKTFAYETIPEQEWDSGGSGFPAGSIIISGSTNSGSGDNAGVTWQLLQPMRTTPTVTTYNPESADNKAVRFDRTTSATVTVVASTSMVNLSIDSGTTGKPYLVGASAVAEL